MLTEGAVVEDVQCHTYDAQAGLKRSLHVQFGEIGVLSLQGWVDWLGRKHNSTERFSRECSHRIREEPLHVSVPACHTLGSIACMCSGMVQGGTMAGLGSLMLRQARPTKRCTGGFVATPFVQYIECVFSFRKAKRTEVEKEYRKKATSVPQDLLRCVT